MQSRKAPNMHANTSLESTDSTGWPLFALLLMVGCVSGAVLYHLDSRAFLYFGDAVSHVVRARQFFDSQRPGFHNIGTVWLPLPHIVLMPLVAMDSLFYTGIAGSLVGIPCLAGTGLLLFHIIRRLTGSQPAAYLGGSLFGLNPNMVYMALTPMNELLFLFLVTLGGYALLRWYQEKQESWLVVSSVGVVLASLCRYEGWILVPLLSLLSAWKGISLRRGGDRGGSLRIIGIACFCWAGVVFWAGWNQFEYGDPLKFARWTYSVAPGSTPGISRLPPLQALLMFGKALLVIFGPVVLVVATRVLLSARWSSVNRLHSTGVLFFFSLPALFALVAIMAGFVQIDQWRWNWRYALTASLFLSIAGGIAASEFFDRVHSTFARSAMVAGLLAMPIVQMLFSPVGVATYHDARRSISDETRFAVALGEQLRGVYVQGTIALLTGYSQAQTIMISSGLPLKQFHIIYNPVEDNILGSLLSSERYLIIGKVRTPESELFVNHWLSRREDLLRYYEVVFEDGHHVFMERTLDSLPHSPPSQ
jgi:hypothetical protein